ncbi:MAG: NYN domain-containing protein [Desulfatibacillum sp.]|nr:NYN domain-containing protein [Desulfatibacillum sp.]
MLQAPETKLTRIGVFYDGNFFYHVSNYYKYVHQRRARLSVAGIHEFIKSQVAESEGVEPRYCQVVDAHYFRGRLGAQEAEQRQVLMSERVFDEILMREGIVTHYLPLGPRGEKGIDVWLALEAFELTLLKHFNVVVLIAGDGDYVPLIRKINTLGTRIMVLGWDFEFTDNQNNKRRTVTSVNLLDQVTYPILMHTLIDDKTRRNDPVVHNLFVRPDFGSNGGSSYRNELPPELPPADSWVRPVQQFQQPTEKRRRGTVQSLKDGYGFIRTDIPGKNMFFHRSNLLDVEFDDLCEFDEVEYIPGLNDRGECALDVTRVASVGNVAPKAFPIYDVEDDEPELVQDQDQDTDQDQDQMPELELESEPEPEEEQHYPKEESYPLWED